MVFLDLFFAVPARRVGTCWQELPAAAGEVPASPGYCRPPGCAAGDWRAAKGGQALVEARRETGSTSAAAIGDYEVGDVEGQCNAATMLKEDIGKDII